MAEPIKTPHTGITATYLGPAGANGIEHSYLLTNPQSGAEEKFTATYPPEDREDSSGQRLPGLNSLFNVDFNTPAGRELASTLAPVFRRLQYKDQRDFIDRAIKPVGRSVPAFFVGGPWDTAGLLSYVPGPDELAMMGYEAVTGETPSLLEKSRARDEAGRKSVAEYYGTEATRRRFQQYLRAADRYAEEKWKFKPFESTMGTDMTPEARGVWEKMTTTGLEFAVSGPVMISGVTVPAKILQEGAKFTFARLAKESAKELGEDALKPENIRSLIDKANAYVNPLLKSGRRNIYGEMGFGAAAGVSTEAALDQLNRIDPDAAGWLKTTVAIGSGLLGPIAGRGVYTAFLQGPIVRLGTRAFVDPLFRPEKSAARFSQDTGFGKSPEDRAGVASVARLLEESVRDGRHIDQASGLAFTTPELARTEANILRAEIQLKRERLSQETDPAVRSRLEKEIEADGANVGFLNRTANFHESVLQSATNDKNLNSVNRFFAEESARLVDRREQFFNYIENTFKRSMDDLDFGGKPGGSVEQHRIDYENVDNLGTTPEFEATRRKLVMEGRPQGVEGSEFAWLNPQTNARVKDIEVDLSSQMEKSFADAQAAAQTRVDFWQESVQSYLADRGLTRATMPAAERKMVGDLIRGTYDDAYREYRAFEKAAYGRIKGLDDKVTENIVFPKGSTDPLDKSDISGMTVAEWAAGRLEKLSRAERFNIKEVPVELAQLTGSRAVLAQLKRQQQEAVAAGRASAAQSRIPDLERRRDEAIAEKQEAEKRFDQQLDTDRLDAERTARSLDEYVQGKMSGLDDSQRQAVQDFTEQPRDWATMTLSDARAMAPAGLGAIFSQVAKQKKSLANLGEGVASSRAAQAIDEDVIRFSEQAQKAQSEITKITEDFLGAGDDVVVEPTGRLTSRDSYGALVSLGVSANDVKETISNIAEATRREVSANGRTPRHRNLIHLRKTLEQLLSTQTFASLDPAALAFARAASRIKNRVDDAQGDILEKDRGAAVKVPVEEVPTKVLPESASPLTRASNIRVLTEATAELPDFVTIRRGDDGEIVTDAEGVSIAVIDEKAIDGRSLFENPESPFELVRVGEAGTPFEIRIKPDRLAPASERSLKVAESILLERLALRFPDGVDSKSLETFRSKNKEALKFLEDNGRGDVPTLIKDADGLATQLDALKVLRNDKTRQQLNELVNRGQLDLQGLSIDDYLDYIGQRRKRFSEENAFSEVINAEAGRGAELLFDQVLDPKNKSPKRSLNEFLSLVRGNRQAEKGLQASIIGQLFKRSTTRDEALIKQAGESFASAFDPVKFRELLSDDRVRSLLREAFPNNPELLPGLDKVAKTAFETSNFTSGGSLGGRIDPQSALSMEAWNNLGRVAGLQFAERVAFVNALVAAGVGSRMFGKIGKNITGNKIKDILINAALDPEIAVGLAKKTSQSQTWLDELAKAAIDAINVPGAIARRPGHAVPVLKRGEEEFDAEEGPQAYLRPLSAPVRQAASAMPARPPLAASALSQVNPVGPGPMAQGTMAQGTMERGQQIFGVHDPIFSAAHGGYADKNSGIMSIKCKPQQIVG